MSTRAIDPASAPPASERASGAVVSVNVGEPKSLRWRGREVRTAIFKSPTDRRLRARGVNLSGDGQADRKNHGGELKAVYGYPSEHYPWWRAQLGELPSEWGAFGENLTLVGVDEHRLAIGDLVAVGGALLRVTEPRYPCFKLGLRLGRDDVVDRFVQANRTGAYFAIAREGEIGAGDTVEVVEPDPDALSVAELMRLRVHSGAADLDSLRRAAECEAVSEEWREHLAKRARQLANPRRPAPGWPGVRHFTVAARRRETADVVVLELRPRDGRQLAPWRPGQFVAVEWPTASGRAAVRCYSLCDPPEPDRLRIAVKRIDLGEADADGGLSARVHELCPGDELALRAPAGSFTVDADAARPLVLVAGGIGVTPIHAIAASVAAGEIDRPTRVLLGARGPEAEPLGASLRRLATGSDRLELSVRYSRAAPAADDRFASRGRLSADDVLEAVGGTDPDVLICGPESMVGDLAEALESAGVGAERIHTEAFGQAAAQAGAEIEVPPGGREVTFARAGDTATWTDARCSVLELAETSGLELPYSCRTGSCGTCLTRLLSGEVAYLRPPAAPLEEDECLTCIAVPASSIEVDA